MDRAGGTKKVEAMATTRKSANKAKTRNEWQVFQQFRSRASLTLLTFRLVTFFTAFSAFAASVPADLKSAARPNNLGVAYMNQQRGEDALAQFKLAIAADNSLAVPHLNAGIVLLVLQRLGESQAELDRAAKIDPVNPRVWYNIGLLQRAQSNCEGSISAFQQVVKIDPASADAHYFLGSCYLEKQEFAKAADEYRAAIQLNGMHPSAEFGLARALQRSGNPAEARVHLARFEHITHEKTRPGHGADLRRPGKLFARRRDQVRISARRPDDPDHLRQHAAAARPQGSCKLVLRTRRTRRRHVPHRPGKGKADPICS